MRCAPTCKLAATIMINVQLFVSIWFDFLEKCNVINGVQLQTWMLDFPMHVYNKYDWEIKIMNC